MDGLVDSWARGPGSSLGNTNANGQAPEVPLARVKGSAFGRRLRSVLGAWCLVRSGSRRRWQPGKARSPSGSKNRRADVACFTSNWSCGVVGSSWSGQCRCNGLEGLEGMEEGRGRRAGSSVVLLQDEKETAETRKLQAKSIRGTTGERDARLSRGWRVAQMINTYIHGQRAGQHELPVLLPRSGVRLMSESGVMETKRPIQNRPVGKKNDLQTSCHLVRVKRTLHTGAATAFLSTKQVQTDKYHCPQVGAWKYPVPRFCYFPWYLTATRLVTWYILSRRPDANHLSTPRGNGHRWYTSIMLSCRNS